MHTHEIYVHCICILNIKRKRNEILVKRRRDEMGGILLNF